MRQRIERYAFFWNVKDNEGHLLFHLEGEENKTATLWLDSPQEGQLLVDILRNEDPVYYDEEHELIMTGLEPVGEGEAGGG